MHFDAFLFDAGGVLVLPDPTVLGPLLAPYGGDTSIDAHRRAHYAAMAVKSMVDAGETDWHEYNMAYVNAVGVDGEHAEHAAMVLDQTRTAHLWRWPIPEAVTTLAELARRCVPMGVVSNASGQIADVLVRAKLCQAGEGSATMMRCVIDSHVVGVAKPDPAIFDRALEYFAELERDRIAYIGDSVKMDVLGARAAGLHPILVDPFDDHPGADFDRIRSLTDLLDMATIADSPQR
jgi:putative hydrolase of the HAD superfamily